MSELVLGTYIQTFLTATLLKSFQNGILLYGDSSPVNSSCHNFAVGLTEIKIKKAISIFPNPFHSSARLEFNSDFETAEIKIYNSYVDDIQQVITYIYLDAESG